MTWLYPATFLLASIVVPAVAQEQISPERLRPSIVKIIVEGETSDGKRTSVAGSGFVVASGPAVPQTFIATAAHVIDGPYSNVRWETDEDKRPIRKITLYFYDNVTGAIKAHAGAVNMVWEDDEIALLSVSGGALPALRLTEQTNDLSVALLMGFNKDDQIATTNEGTIEEEQGGLFGKALRLGFLAGNGQSGGAVVGPDGAAIAVVNYNYPTGAPAYHVAFRVSPIIDVLRKLGIDPTRGIPIPYRNGIFAGSWLDNLPSGKGTFSFEPGLSTPSHLASRMWQLTGSFRDGEPDGAFTLTGPIAEDSRPQSCNLNFTIGRIANGECSIFLIGFKSPLGVDPRVRRSLERGSFVDAEFNRPGETTFDGRYTGAVTGGKKTLFDPSNYMIERLSEEHILPHGAGRFEVSGGWALFSANVDANVGFGPMVLDGRWLLGSFTGEGSVRMPNGSIIKGIFDAGYIKDGEAIKATGNVFGAVWFSYDVYTGHMRNGWPDGQGDRTNNRLGEDLRERGEFRAGALRNGTRTYTENDIRWCNVVTEGKVTAEHDMGPNPSCP